MRTLLLLDEGQWLLPGYQIGSRQEEISVILKYAKANVRSYQVQILLVYIFNVNCTS